MSIDWILIYWKRNILTKLEAYREMILHAMLLLGDGERTWAGKFFGICVMLWKVLMEEVGCFDGALLSGELILLQNCKKTGAAMPGIAKENGLKIEVYPLSMTRHSLVWVTHSALARFCRVQEIHLSPSPRWLTNWRISHFNCKTNYSLSCVMSQLRYNFCFTSNCPKNHKK